MLLGLLHFKRSSIIRDVPIALVHSVSLSIIPFTKRRLIFLLREFPIGNMTPLWTFPAYPLLLTGPVAANLISALPDATAAARIDSTAIAFGAICFQGIGFLLSLMIYSAFLYRLMTKKLPQETTRPGMVSYTRNYCPTY